MPRRYGWIRDYPNPQDKLYSAVRPGKKIEDLPISVDIKTPEIKDQSTLGSCTGFGLTGAAQTVMIADRGADDDVEFSELFVYWNERNLEGTVNEDAGAMIRTGMEVLTKIGMCFRFNWPYEINHWRDEPPHICYSQAEKFRITDYARINNRSLVEILECLADGYPIVFGFSVFESFESEFTTRTGIVEIPNPWSGDRLLGGHCVYACGYNRAEKYVKIANSWGVGAGDHGYYYFPFDYLTNPLLAADFWTMRAGANFDRT